MSDLRDADWELLVLKHFIHRCLEQVTLTLAGQDADILLNYCSTEDITGKPSTQLRAPVPVSILNPNGEVIIQKLFDNMRQAN